MEWWERVLQSGLVGVISIFGIKEGLPLLRFLIEEGILNNHSKHHSDSHLQQKILNKLDKLDNLIEQEQKILTLLGSNHTEIYRLLLEKNYKTDDLLPILNKIEMSLQQISLDLRLQQELMRKSCEAVFNETKTEKQ
jgi:hypothetical protein